MRKCYVKKLLAALFGIMILLCVSVSAAEKRMEANATSDPDKYQHTINMGLLLDYIYGGSLAQSGKVCDTRKFLPDEWKMHERPASVPLVGMTVIHVGDEGELSSVHASFVNEPVG